MCKCKVIHCSTGKACKERMVELFEDSLAANMLLEKTKTRKREWKELGVGSGSV